MTSQGNISGLLPFLSFWEKHFSSQYTFFTQVLKEFNIQHNYSKSHLQKFFHDAIPIISHDKHMIKREQSSFRYFNNIQLYHQSKCMKFDFLLPFPLLQNNQAFASFLFDMAAFKIPFQSPYRLGMGTLKIQFFK
jgi:hypothetical protein